MQCQSFDVKGAKKVEVPVVAVGTIETLVSNVPHVTSLFKINNRMFNYVSLNVN